MTRTLFLLTALTAMLAATTAVLLRAEMAYPGVSALFESTDGFPDIARFETVVVVHGLVSFLAATLVGAYMASVAQARGARLGGFCLWAGVLAALAVLVIMVVVLSPALLAGLAADTQGADWGLFPPVSADGPRSVFGTLLAAPDADFNSFSNNLNRYLLLPAAFSVFLGAYALVSTEPGFGVLSVVGAPLVILLTVMNVSLISAPDPFSMSMLFFLLSLPLLTCASIRLIDTATAGLIVLTVGMIASITGYWLMVLVSQAAFLSNSLIEPIAAYVFPLGFVWFALPATMIYARTSQIAGWAPWAISVALCLGLALWLTPLFQLIQEGQAPHYIDYPEIYATTNLQATAAVALFAVIYLACIVMIRRAPRSTA